MPEPLIKDCVALFVDKRGLYPTILEHWYDEKRDATTYTGDLPIVGHPPCQRWCRLAGLVEARWGHKRGEDGGLFASALANVRRVGGVLEHPAFSDAWKAYGLPEPKSGAGWQPGAAAGEWTCYVEQCAYGHKAKKATWLYYVGVRPPLEMRWTLTPDHAQKSWVSWCGNKTGKHGEDRPRLKKSEAIHTPPDFAADLIALALWARGYASLTV